MEVNYFQILLIDITFLMLKSENQSDIKNWKTNIIVPGG